jgi:hypothetical protein
MPTVAARQRGGPLDGTAPASLARTASTGAARIPIYFVLSIEAQGRIQTMLLEQYYQENHQGIHFSRQQASRFAKEVAGDFNPIHDPEAKRFCVPGDLLFALVLSKYGLSQRMRFLFSELVGDGVQLSLPDSTAPQLDIYGDNGKKYLSLFREGDTSDDQKLIQDLTSSYVRFSGQTFPHVLVPLMSQKQVMINPDRPLVIYESMAINLQRLDIADPQLELTGTNLDVSGKRGKVCLEFQLKASGEIVGQGEKNMILSGLRAFEADKVDTLVAGYNARKQSYSP